MSQISNIYQGDGADSISEDGASDDEQNSSIDEPEQEDEREEHDDDYITDVEDDNDDQDESENDDNEGDTEGNQNTHGEIPVIITDRRHLQNQSIERGECALRPIVANDRVAASAELPTIAVTNFRSLGPRLQHVKDDMLLRQIDVLVGSETWQKDSNRKLKDDIEELLQIHGIEYISCPRPNTKRGRGVAILVNTKRFSITKLDILVPSKLEVVWGILRPKEVTNPNIF